MPEQQDGFEPAGFAQGFLDRSGPYFLRPDGTSTIVALRVLESHGNYTGVAHGGVLATLADVALSFQLHDSERPRLQVATVSMTTNFLASVVAGDWLEAHCRIDRKGQRIAYASGEIRRGDQIVMTMSGVYSIIRKP